MCDTLSILFPPHMLQAACIRSLACALLPSLESSLRCYLDLALPIIISHDQEQA